MAAGQATGRGRPMNLYLRADGSQELGLGHLARCHALAQEARRRKMLPRFLTRRLDGKGVAKLRAQKEETLLLEGPSDNPADLEATLGAMGRAEGGRSLKDAILVTDHNGIDAAWLRGAREAGPVVVSLNDLPRIRYASSIVVNGNVGAEKFIYETEPGTELLLGPAYMFFRDEFLEPDPGRGAHSPRAANIVIAMGAGDPGNVTQGVLEALSSIRDPLTITAVVGGAYRHLPSLEEAARSSRHEVRVAFDLARTARTFAAAELAVCAGGSTACEMALLGVPAIVVVLSETQKNAAEALEAEGVALCIGPPDPEHIAGSLDVLRRDPGRRRSMRERGTALFNGGGRARVLDAAESCLEGARGKLKP